VPGGLVVLVDNGVAQPVPSTSPGQHCGQHGVPGMMTAEEMKQMMAASGPAFDKMFLQMMIRHHQGAIEMAKIELRDGRNAEAKALTAKIVTDQTAEIRVMQKLLQSA
jgi:uncharacterized protein (DUF305 family)